MGACRIGRAAQAGGHVDHGQAIAKCREHALLAAGQPVGLGEKIQPQSAGLRAFLEHQRAVNRPAGHGVGHRQDGDVGLATVEPEGEVAATTGLDAVDRFLQGHRVARQRGFDHAAGQPQAAAHAQFATRRRARVQQPAPRVDDRHTECQFVEQRGPGHVRALLGLGRVCGAFDLVIGEFAVAVRVGVAVSFLKSFPVHDAPCACHD